MSKRVVQAVEDITKGSFVVVGRGGTGRPHSGAGLPRGATFGTALENIKAGTSGEIELALKRFCPDCGETMTRERRAFPEGANAAFIGDDYWVCTNADCGRVDPVED